MPLYQVRNASCNSILGHYIGDRPSAAACKASTSMRRKDPMLKTMRLKVLTEGRKMHVTFEVTYEAASSDAFSEACGIVNRPKARKVTNDS